MMRQLRRQLRAWKREIQGFWGRFNTFYRIVIGSVIAMIMIVGARRKMLDPLCAETAKAKKALVEAGAPEQVCLPEHDNDVQEDELRAENLHKTLAEWKTKVQKLAAELPVSASVKSEAVARLDAALDQCGLTVRRREAVEPPEDLPVKCSRHHYQVYGSFPGIYQFVKATDDLPYVCMLDKIALEPMTGEDGELLSVGGECPVLLSFDFTLFFVGN